MNNPHKFLIYSIEHRAFWKPNECGYTERFDQAGLYDHDTAVNICRNANLHCGDKPNETMVPVVSVAPAPFTFEDVAKVHEDVMKRGPEIDVALVPRGVMERMKTGVRHRANCGTCIHWERQHRSIMFGGCRIHGKTTVSIDRCNSFEGTGIPVAGETGGEG